MPWAEENLPVPSSIKEATQQRNGWCNTAAFHHKNEQFYRNIIVQIGNMFGEAARTSDDGTVQDDVLVLRVPELVYAALAKARGDAA